MAYSLFVNTVHVCFESVLAMDNAGMVAMFESLVDTRLKGFLGCPTVIHEAALLEFFANGSVRDGLIVSTVNGVTVEISEQLFAETFELPVEGLTYLSEIPKDLVFDSRSIVSLSGEPVIMSGKKNEMAIEFRLLCDILAKTISVKAGSFDAITQEKFLMMAAITCGVRINWNRLLFNIFKDMVTLGSGQAKGYAIQISLLLENVPNLELGESSEFPSSKVLTDKTVHRYIVLNDKVGMEVVSAEPRVKKTPTKKATKRPATDAAVAPVVKKKRTTKIVPTEQPPVPKQKTQKRKRRLILGSDDEIVDSEPVVGGSIVGEAAVEGVEDTAEKDVGTVVESVGISEAETVVDSVNVETVVESVNEPVVESTAETNNALGEVMKKIDLIKRVFLDSIAEQNETFRGLFKRSRQEAQNDNNALSLALKAVRNQNVILSTDLEATSKEVKDIKAALSKDFDDKLADIRNELLEFRVDTQGQLASLSTHLTELIAFLTKNSDDKKGEGSSSRPQPPPDNQSRPSGGNGGSGNRA
ncbi:hypothetical protein F511_02659 [Dorcoceras hygrometricum]|uniref:Dystroglycan-like n=1 Tax=Dorcoceras hygrometricum TaxID=472368 RepID=A0A2Z7D5B4_9LAMI|nr:hypothetical protein F511_02659 [Dorcoceras hygrometricum]